MRAADVSETAAARVGREVVEILERSMPQTWPHAAFAPGFVERMGDFGRLLAYWGSRFNLTSRPADPAALAFHIMDCASLLALKEEVDFLKGGFGPGRSIADIGSGCGFPGVVLASGCDARVVLFEPRLKRAAFLRIVATELALGNVQISGLSLPSMRIQACFDVAVGRATGAAARFYRLAHTVLLPGGIAILYATRSQGIGANRERDVGFAPGRSLSYRLRLAAPGRTESAARDMTELGAQRILRVSEKHDKKGQADDGAQ